MDNSTVNSFVFVCVSSVDRKVFAPAGGFPFRRFSTGFFRGSGVGSPTLNIVSSAA